MGQGPGFPGAWMSRRCVEEYARSLTSVAGSQGPGRTSDDAGVPDEATGSWRAGAGGGWRHMLFWRPVAGFRAG